MFAVELGLRDGESLSSSQSTGRVEDSTPFEGDLAKRLSHQTKRALDSIREGQAMLDDEKLKVLKQGIELSRQMMDPSAATPQQIMEDGEETNPSSATASPRNSISQRGGEDNEMKEDHDQGLSRKAEQASSNLSKIEETEDAEGKGTGKAPGKSVAAPSKKRPFLSRCFCCYCCTSSEPSKVVSTRLAKVSKISKMLKRGVGGSDQKSNAGVEPHSPSLRDSASPNSSPRPTTIHPGVARDSGSTNGSPRETAVQAEDPRKSGSPSSSPRQTELHFDERKAAIDKGQPPPVSELMSSLDGSLVVQRHTTRVNNRENYDFLMAMKGINSGIEIDAQIIARLESIMTRFINVGAPQEVNLSSKLRGETLKHHQAQDYIQLILSLQDVVTEVQGLLSVSLRNSVELNSYREEEDRKQQRKSEQKSKIQGKGGVVSKN